MQSLGAKTEQVMRPVIRPNGDYYNLSLRTNGASGIGQNAPTRCMALCIQEEINRLHGIIAVLPAAGGENAIAAAIVIQVNMAAIPTTIPALAIPAVAAVGGFAGFVGGTYDAAIAALPVANRALVDNYIHYCIIQRNLRYNIAANDWVFGVLPTMVIGDIPYAVSAMQDAREQVREAVAGASIYSAAAGIVNIGVAPAGGFLLHFTVTDINNHIRTLYTAWDTAADTNPSAYTNAAAELVNQLGPYCAYCEANLKTQIDVEHMLPKAPGATAVGIKQGFSSHAKSWLNFLPSCPRCNSTKQSQPSKHRITLLAVAIPGFNFTKDDGRNLAPLAVVAGPPAGGDTRITDREYARLYQNFYQFPLEPASYQNVGFALWNQTTNAIDNTAIAIQINWTINSVDEIGKVVRVNIPGLPVAPGVPARGYRVYIDDGTYGLNFLLPTQFAAINKVSQMQQICGLNTTNANTDRRVLERTEAWFMALAAVHRIQTDLAGLGGLALGAAAANVYNRVYQLWRDNVILTIKEKGFISVWLKIFSQFPHPLTGTPGTVPTFPAMLLGNEVHGAVAGGPMNLVQDIATAIKDSRYFPHTNFAQVP